MAYLPIKSYINHGLTYAAPNGYPITGSNRSSTLGSIYLTRFYAPENITVNSIGVNCVTGVTGATLSLGIYNPPSTPTTTQGYTIVGGSIAPYPSGLVADTTKSLGTITGTLSSSVSLTAGSTYYFGVLSTGAAPVLSGYSVASATTWYGTGVGQYISHRSVTMAYTVTGASAVGTAYTYTITGTHVLAVGASVIVTGSSIAAYNGTFTITGVTSNTFTVTGGTSSPGTPTFNAGTAQNAAMPPTFSGNTITETAAGNSGYSMAFTIN